jgi:hypothetical protein
MFLVAYLLSFAVVAFAQTDRSSLTGNVTDGQGHRVPQAEVRAIQTSTGLERRTVTSAQGTYAIDSLPLGRYTVIFSKTGFSDVRVEQVEQSIGQTRTLNAQLGVAQNKQSATVEDALVQLDRTSGVVGGSIEQNQLEELPLNGRNWSHLTALAPGAIDNGASDQRTIRFAGHGLDDNNFSFDGVDASGILNQAQKEYVRLAIPLDSIASFAWKPRTSAPKLDRPVAARSRWRLLPEPILSTAAFSITCGIRISIRVRPSTEVHPRRLC